MNISALSRGAVASAVLGLTLAACGSSASSSTSSTTAMIELDGSFVLGVLDGKPARLDVVGTTLQLLYEVHDPRLYHTPDLTLDFGELLLEEVGENRVRVTGARGAGRPETLKAIGFVKRPGEVADVEITYAGEGAVARAMVARDVLRERVELLGLRDYAVDLVGIDSVLGAVACLPPGYAPPELRVHISARCTEAEEAQAVEDEVYALTLSGPAGGASLRSERRPQR